MRTALSVFLLALAVRIAAIVYWQFDGLYGQDPFAYFDQAVAVATALPHGQWPATVFYWPSGYPLVAAAVMWLAGPQPVAAQLVNVVCGAGLAALAVLLCRDVAPRASLRAGVIAGLIVAVAGQAVVSSIVIMADMPAAFWASLAAWLAVRRLRRPAGVLEPTAVALCLGIATITRWVTGLVTPVFMGVLLWAREGGARAAALRMVPGVAVWTAILALQAWALVDRPEALQQHQHLVGWSPLNAFRTTFSSVDGVVSYWLPVGVFYLLPAAHPAYLMPPLGLFTGLGALRLYREGAWRELALLFGWVLAVYVFLAGIPLHNLRFGLSLWMPLVVLTGLGADSLWTRRGAAGLVARGVVAVSVVAMLGWSVRSVDGLVSRQDSRRDLVRMVEQRLPEDAVLMAFDVTLTARHYTRLRVVELFGEDARSLDELTRKHRTSYLLVNPASIATQWRGLAPDRNLRWLRERTAVSPLASYPPFELYEVRRDRPGGRP